MLKLKKNWTQCKVSDIGEYIRGVTYKKQEASKEIKDGFVPILRANNIGTEISFVDLVFVPNKCLVDSQLIHANDILFAMSSGSKHLVGKTAQAKVDFDGGFGAFCGVIRPRRNIDPKYLGLFFKGPEYKQFVSTLATGININNLRQNDILDLIFPLPPLAEQHRIVAKIEELFSDLDAGIASLKKAKEQLKTYRQSVLKNGILGKLSDKLAIDLGKTEWKKLGTKIEHPRYGTSKKCDLQETAWPVLRIPNIGSIQVDKTDLKYASFLKDEIESLKLAVGDLLIIRSNGSPSIVGKCSMIKNSEVHCLYAGYLIRLRPQKEELDSKFLYYTLNSPHLRQQIEEKAKSTSGVNNINSEEICSLLIPEIPLEEQVNIASEIESRLSEADNLDKTLDAALAQSESLRQSILKQAFEGKLVPQDPNDEPAEKLLERIRAERAASDEAPKKRLTTEERGRYGGGSPSEMRSVAARSGTPVEGGVPKPRRGRQQREKVTAVKRRG